MATNSPQKPLVLQSSLGNLSRPLLSAAQLSPARLQSAHQGIISGVLYMRKQQCQQGSRPFVRGCAANHEESHRDFSLKPGKCFFFFFSVKKSHFLCEEISFDSGYELSVRLSSICNSIAAGHVS